MRWHQWIHFAVAFNAHIVYKSSHHLFLFELYASASLFNLSTIIRLFRVYLARNSTYTRATKRYISNEFQSSEWLNLLYAVCVCANVRYNYDRSATLNAWHSYDMDKGARWLKLQANNGMWQFSKTANCILCCIDFRTFFFFGNHQLVNSTKGNRLNDNSSR